MANEPLVWSCIAYFVVYRHTDSKTYERERERELRNPAYISMDLRPLVSTSRLSDVYQLLRQSLSGLESLELSADRPQTAGLVLRQLLKTFFWELKLHFRNTVVTLFTIPSMGQLLCL